MKYSIIVIRNEIISRFDKDRAAWWYVGFHLKKNETQAADLVGFAEKINQRFPELPNKMVWGNYLIPTIDENFLVFDIDASPEQIDEIVLYIIQQANEQGLAVLDGKKEKIYRPTST
ncbi:MAG: hypothetical protein LBE91_08520 [Tannerella sp.]|jgi:hypothetical protein|nr:hypothetical protein [Tannerella sp.]